MTACNTANSPAPVNAATAVTTTPASRDASGSNSRSERATITPTENPMPAARTPDRGPTQ